MPARGILSGPAIDSNIPRVGTSTRPGGGPTLGTGAKNAVPLSLPPPSKAQTAGPGQATTGWKGQQALGKGKNALVTQVKGLQSNQAPAQTNPGGYTSLSAVNPLQQAAYGGAVGAQKNAQGAQNQMQKFADDLASKKNALITGELARGRDLSAHMLDDARGAAGARGGAPGSGLSSLFQLRAGQDAARQLQGLNATATGQALNAEQGARASVIGGAQGVTAAAGGVTGAANQAAIDQTKRDEQAAELWKFTNNFQLSKAKADLEQQNFLLETTLKYMNPFTGANNGAGGSGGLPGGSGSLAVGTPNSENSVSKSTFPFGRS